MGYARPQSRVITEILADMGSPQGHPWMRQLLNGDVGSGKTAVAFVALIAVAASGHQAALMAPTEIVAEQHAEVGEETVRSGQSQVGL